MTTKTANIPQQPVILPFSAKPNSRNRRQGQLRSDANRMLNEMAFVLKMTQRVRDEMDAAKEEPIHV